MYKSILIPIDVSSEERIYQGNRMIAVARKLADADTRIVLLNVVEDIPPYVAAELPGGMLKRTIEQAKATLQSITKNAGLDAKLIIQSGRPHKGILDAADDHQTDMIVIASHRPELTDYLLGSTAARVVRHAKCSVHVLR